MELIFIRHGKAETGDAEKEDALRDLTPSGSKLLKKAMPNLRLLIRNSEDIHIWSSPLKRAAESAWIAARALGVKDIEIHDFISTGDFAAFSRELAKCHPKCCLIIIGHEPFLSEWSQLVCGFTLPFRKGASAGFLLTNMNPPEGKLKWLVNLKTLGKLD